MLESKFQSDLIKELREIFPGCVILKNDSSYLQGIPDLTILYGNRWAVLECKDSATARYQPNQEYYLDLLNRMSVAQTVYPENKDAVLNYLVEEIG
jgi:hypothetical protein